MPGSNVKVNPALIFGVDSDGLPHAIVNGNGFLKAGIEEFGLQDVSGTMTRSGAAATVEIDITPGDTADLLVLCYGRLEYSAVKASTAGSLIIYPAHLIGTGSEFSRGNLATIANFPAAGIVSIPGRGTAPTSSDNILQPVSIGLVIGGGDGIHIEVGTMSDTETFRMSIVFMSKIDVAPATNTTNGVFVAD